MSDKDHVTRNATGNPEPADSAFPNTMSRRQVLKLGGLGSIGAVSLLVVGIHPAEIEARIQEAASQREVYGPNAKGLLIHIPARCVGCRRCEQACTEYREGKSAPAMARVKVARNYHFGQQGLRQGYLDGEGRFGNHLIVANTCLQCAHPTPCQLACPNDAIEIAEPVNARVVNAEKCVGCRTCQSACPWEMPAFDQEAGVATKCDLCAGKPNCVEACPAGALQYVPWVDLTQQIPERTVVPAFVSAPADVAEACSQCH